MAKDAVSATGVAAGGDHTGDWHDASRYRRFAATADGNGTLNVSVHVELDYSGDGSVDKTFSGTAGTTSSLDEQTMLAEQVRIRVHNEDGVSAQDVTGTLLLSD